MDSELFRSMNRGDQIYFLVDRFTEVAGTFVSFDDMSGEVVVQDNDEGDLLRGFEEHTRPNDDITAAALFSRPRN